MRHAIRDTYRSHAECIASTWEKLPPASAGYRVFFFQVYHLCDSWTILIRPMIYPLEKDVYVHAPLLAPCDAVVHIVVLVLRFRVLMDQHLPQLLEHLDSRGLQPEILACDFFLSLGCRALPPLTVLRVWDVLLWKGGETLQYIALAVLHLAQVTCFGILHLSVERTVLRPTSADHLWHP